MSKPPLWWHLAWRELRNNRGFVLSFVVSLGLGLVGFLLIDAFKASISSHIENRSKSILAADLRVSTRRAWTDEERKMIDSALPQGSIMREEQGLFSMVAAGDRSRLIELRAIDDQFPFYGELGLQEGEPLQPGQGAGILGKREVWVYPEVLFQLGIELGDKVRLGDLEYTVSNVVTNDPSVSTVGFAVAPKIFIDLDQLPETGLIKKGSRVNRGLFVKLPPGINDEESAKTLREAISGTDIRVATHKTASEQLNRVLIYLNDYLGLVAMVALFLAGVGTAYLFRSYLSRRCADIAIMQALGAEASLPRAVYISQLVVLGTGAALLSGVFAAILLPALPLALGDLMPSELAVEWRLDGFVVALLVGVLGSLLFCGPLLQRLSVLKPATLFQEDSRPTMSLSIKHAALWLPALIVYWALAVRQSHSLLTGSLFLAVFLVSGALVAGAGTLSLWLFDRENLQAPMSRQMARLNLTRHRVGTLACFLAVSLGALLVSIIPQVRNVLDQEFASPEGDQKPSLFLFDIQDEQVQRLQGIVADQGREIRNLSPMILARLSEINGEAPSTAVMDSDENRQVQERQRTRNRTYNLSYRATLSETETLVAGRLFEGPYTGDGSTPAEISVETRFADRLQVGLGDTLTFEIQGVEVQGKIVNLRRVRWASFQPNFFIQFQPGLLDPAPKTWIASVGKGASLEEDVILQNEIVGAMPNISIVDVSKTVRRIMEIVDQMTVAVAFMALLTLVAGVAVLFAIASHQAQSRVRDISLLKAIGLRFEAIRAMTAIEFGALGFLSGLLGASLSVVASALVTFVLFESPVQPALGIPVATVVVVTLLCLFAGLLATGRALRAKPADLL